MLRELQRDTIINITARLCIQACCHVPDELIPALEKAMESESGSAADILSQIIENDRLASQVDRPCCQDTGLAVIFADLGRDCHVGFDLYDAINEGVREGYTQGYLRKSAASPLGRVNTGDNTPAIVHLRLTEGDRLRLAVLPKGFGSENKSRIGMLTPSAGIQGVEDFIVETAKLGAASACAPVILGVGVGGAFDSCPVLARRQLMRPLGQPSTDKELAELEKRCLDRINALGIGPMGLGGNTTALAVHIGAETTHIAGLPVAVNMMCHAQRHAEAEI